MNGTGWYLCQPEQDEGWRQQPDNAFAFDSYTYLFLCIYCQQPKTLQTCHILRDYPQYCTNVINEMMDVCRLSTLPLRQRGDVSMIRWFSKMQNWNLYKHIVIWQSLCCHWAALSRLPAQDEISHVCGHTHTYLYTRSTYIRNFDIVMTFTGIIPSPTSYPNPPS